MPLLLELLHVLRGRAAGAGLEEPATVQERDDGEHARAGADLQDGEEIGEIVPEDVPGDRDGVLTSADPLQRVLHGLDRGEDLHRQAGGVLGLQIALHLADELGVVRPLPVQPEHRRGSGGARAGHGELHPVVNGGVLGLAGPPDIAFLHLMLQERPAVGVHHADGACFGHLEGLVVGSVLLGLLRHEPDIGDAAHAGGVELPVRLAIPHHRVVDAGVAGVRDHGLAVLQLAVGVPHAPGITDHGRHRGIDDDVAGDVQVGDAAVRIHHGEARPALVCRVDVRLDGSSAILRKLAQLGHDVAQAVVGVRAHFLQERAVLPEHFGEEDPHAVAEDDGVRDLHHRGLHVQGEQDAAVPGRPAPRPPGTRPAPSCS